MIQFKDITLADKKAIDCCLTGNPYRACDFSFTNLYAWKACFKTMFTIERETLFLRSQDINGQYYYMMPIGKMPLKEAFALIREDARQNGIPFVMKAISERMWIRIEAEMPGEFRYTHDRDNDEYIYLSERLINLSGKKLQSKRNHINRFKADNPDWEYFPLTSQSDYQECVDMLDDWEDAHNDGDKALRCDYIATKLMLDNFEYLGLRGGGIRVNGKLVAFTIGEPLTEDSFVVHVEKAYAEINGAYTIINQEFVRNEASHFTYINREEDMGLENLRKAKMSYIPDILLQEAIVVPVNP
ncbi:DUF2156 domain-containing protein [Dysgonomonas sp. 25]|uniref:DUF2156 domain-containing protein n=1 Tax=Dysgonomonas sp. 25 TaxID=2302933 RepID=UPI0013D13780|nr:phosphatidylglycerol lysyltransferase domain-containing protein [Dysgonomonas sp. 25]NDV70085.1 DUF2156 domain-containing protein [Dysgonomonas sp. 25]